MNPVNYRLTPPKKIHTTEEKYIPTKNRNKNKRINGPRKKHKPGIIPRETAEK